MASTGELLEDISEKLGELPEKLAALLRGGMGAAGGSGGEGEGGAPADDFAGKKNYGGAAFRKGYGGVMKIGQGLGGPFGALAGIMGKAKQIEDGIADIVGAFQGRKTPKQEASAPPASLPKKQQPEPAFNPPTIPKAPNLPPVPLAGASPKPPAKTTPPPPPAPGWGQWPILPIPRAQLPNPRVPPPPGLFATPSAQPALAPATPTPPPPPRTPPPPRPRIEEQTNRLLASPGSHGGSGASAQPADRLAQALEKLTAVVDKLDVDEGGGGVGAPEVSKGKPAIQPETKSEGKEGRAQSPKLPGGGSGPLSKIMGTIKTGAELIKFLRGR